MMRSKFFLFFILLLFSASIAYAEECEITFFFSPTCPHCASEKVFLNELEGEHPDLTVNRYDIGRNYELFEQFSEDHNSIPVGVPRTFVRDKVFVGFTEEYGELDYVQGYEAYNGYSNQIEAEILRCLGDEKGAAELCEPVTEEKHLRLWVVPALLGLGFLIFFLTFRTKVKKRFMIGTFIATLIVALFYLAQSMPKQSILTFAEQFSFPIFTFILALLDGFNPCAFAVLAVLLSLLIYSKSKGKMALIGIIFIITSGLMYFLFITILLTLRAELLGEYKDIMRIIVGMIALVAGAINLKDFFWFKKGISLTISNTQMGKLTQKMKGVVNRVKEADTAGKMFIAITATIILAALVNVVELGCTLILPVEFIEVMITNFGTQLTSLHVVYTAFYSAVYVIPLFVILASFLYSFKSERVTETQGRVLKLISGLIMVGLGLILILKPELLMFV